jgi:hypothetical protein
MAHVVRPAFSPAHEARLPARQSIDADNPYGGLCLPSAAGRRAISALRNLPLEDLGGRATQG